MAEAVGLLASVVQLINATTKTYRYLHDVRNATKERSQLGLELAQLLPTLEEFRSRIENANPNEPITKDCMRLGTADGPLKNIIVAIESLRDRLKAGKGISGLGKRLAWTLNKHDVQDAMKRIDRFKTLLTLALQNESIRLSQAIKADTNNMPILVDQVAQIHDRMSLNETIRDDRDDDARRHKIAEWLSSLDFGNSHRSALNNRTDDTGNWFLEAQEFQDWVAEPGATLYCPGIPGAGKTIIAAIAIVHLQEIWRNRKVLVLYVYCYHKEESRYTLENMLCGFLKQALQQSNTVPDAIHQLWHKHTKKDGRPNMTELTSTLVSVLSSSERSFLVVDALDEYSQAKHKRNAFLDILSIIKEHCNIILTSRPAITVSDRFPKARHLEIRARETDVRRYVKSQIPILARCVRLKAELQKLIEDTIAEAVDGMFLLAQLYMQSLTDKLDPRKIKAALATFPKGSGLAAYNAAYDETLSRITTQAPGFRDLAIKAISWIALAQRSLTIRELQHALAVEPEDKDFDEDNLQDMEMIRSVCAGLVVLDEETGTARFVHYTTQEYFRWGSHEFLDDANTLLASTCITYLLFEVVQEDVREDYIWENLEKTKLKPYFPVYKYALLNYACQFWSFHARHSDSSDTIQHALGLLNHQQRLMKVLAFGWEFGCRRYPLDLFDDSSLQAYFDDSSLQNYFDDSSLQDYVFVMEPGPGSVVERFQPYITELSCSRLCTATLFGLSKVAEVLIGQGADVSQEMGARQLTALHYAVAGEHEDIVALLLDVGADPNLSPKGVPIHTPLYIAAGLGSECIVRLLVDKGAEITMNTDTEEAPLTIAIIQGHMSIAKFLLQKNPDSVYLTSLLCDTAWHGKMRTVACLLELGVDVQATARHTHSPSAIHFAIDRNHADIAKLLIEHGADLNRPFAWDWEESAPLQNPLQRAAKQGDLPTVELMLSYNTHTDHPAGEYNVDIRSPLWYACALGNSTIQISYTLLFNHGWHHTSARYYLIARALLAQGADVNTSDDDGVTPLHLAAYTGHPLMVQMLLDYRASVNQKDRSGRTALYFGRLRMNNPQVDRMQSIRIIEILLDHGAEDTEIPTDNSLEENVQHDEQIVELSD